MEQQNNNCIGINTKIIGPKCPFHSLICPAEQQACFFNAPVLAVLPE